MLKIEVVAPARALVVAGNLLDQVMIAGRNEQLVRLAIARIGAAVEELLVVFAESERRRTVVNKVDSACFYNCHNLSARLSTTKPLR